MLFKNTTFARLVKLTLVLGLGLAVLAGQAPGPPGTDGCISVLLFAGQSNALGYHSSLIPPHERMASAHANVIFWARMADSEIGDGTFRWRSLRQRQWPGNWLLGPELSAGQVIADQLHGSLIMVVKLAVDGAALAQVPGEDWNPHSEGEVLDRYFARTRAALSTLPPDNKPPVRAFFWIQGESDAKSGGRGPTYGRQPEIANQYLPNLRALIRRVRAEYANPDLPVFVASISAPPEDNTGRQFGLAPTVLRAQQLVAATDPHVFLIATDDLEKAADGLHYNVAGQIELGRRLANAYLTMQSNGNSTHQSPQCPLGES